MKKKILLFTSALALVSALTMSYSIGPAAMNSENRTGADGGVANCGNGSCHSGSAYTTSLEFIRFYENATEVHVWEPGHTYIVVISGNTTAPKYGFQVSASYNDGSYHPAGVFEATNATTHDTIVNGYSIVEHNSALLVQNQNFGVNMEWTAPANIIVDTLYFHCTVNNVNGDGLQTGDNSTHFSQKMGCKTLSVAQLSADIKINAYPNPVTDKLNISIDNADKGDYTISVFDMHGKMVSAQTANVNKSFSTSVNASSWAAGMYHVQLKKEDAQRTIAVVKQ